MKKPADVENNEMIKARHDDTQKAFSNLLEMLIDVADQEWHEQAACRGANGDKFFPGRGDTKNLEAARAICDMCIVSTECEEYAIDRPEIQSGVWGGTTNSDRRQIRKQIREEKKAS